MSVASKTARWPRILGTAIIDILALFAIVLIVYLIILQGGLSTVDSIAEHHASFWNARAREVDDLCHSKDVPGYPELPKAGNPAARLSWLKSMIAPSETIWETFAGCQEPRMLVVTEDLLHFRVNLPLSIESARRRLDGQFVNNPTRGFDTIHRYVSTNFPIHGKTRVEINVRGHTDDTFTEEYNFELGYRRALLVAMNIRDFLIKAGYEKTEFTINPVGVGKSELLPRTGDLDSWRTSCRRIEISFRSIRI